MIVKKINTKIFYFKVAKDLEKSPNTTAKKCLHFFLQKGGVLKSIPDLLQVNSPCIKLNLNDAIYPVCSGGWCRSQTLWAILHPFSDKIVLFPPHAACLGWDPYNGKINIYKNYDKELMPDEFFSYFKMEKSLRFGFENTLKWKLIEQHPTDIGLKNISSFYDNYYFGPNSSWKNKQGKKRVYITFSQNAHVVIYRLCQANDNLHNVIVVAIDSDDLLTNPPTFLNTTPRSKKSYEYFSNLLFRSIDLTELH